MRSQEVKVVTIQMVIDIFCNIEAISAEHQNLLKRLEALLNDPGWPFFFGIGDCFLTVSQTLLPAYGSYTEVCTRPCTWGSEAASMVVTGRLPLCVCVGTPSSSCAAEHTHTNGDSQ